MKVEYGITWSRQAAEDFEDLRTLLRECRSIDSGNQIIDRLKRIEGLAKQVGRSPFTAGILSTDGLMYQLEIGFGVWVRKDLELEMLTAGPAAGE